MKFTNKFNLPSSLVNAITNDTYSRGEADISVTGVINSPRQSQLSREHYHEMEKDVSDQLWSLYGKLVHKLLEDADEKGLTEERYFMECEGWIISGQADRVLLKEKHLSDYKFVGVQKMQDGVPADYEAQVNLYVELKS